MDKNDSGAPDNRSSRMGFRYSDIIVFIVAALFLSAILFAGFNVADIQTNILYLVVLSLSCAMVFAFLPFDASLNQNGIVKAGGTAAIFALTLYIVTSFTEKNYLESKSSADLQITNLQEILKSKDDELTRLRETIGQIESGGNACSSSTALVRSSLAQIEPAFASLSSDVSEGIQYSTAARDNSSDSRACSARGSQSLEALSRARVRLDAIASNLATMKNALQ